MGTLSEDLTAIKTVEDTLNGNKVARFSYTETAYCCNCANGVTEYDVDRENNIPVGNASIMKLNETILSKGWRAQASAITRMAMNHFLGRLSYNVNKLTDNMTGLLNTLVSHVGNANGLATLDANGRIPYSQLPESAMEYIGSWNANTNTPQLADGMSGADRGDFYVVSVAGTQNLGSGSIQFFVNDRVIYSGSVWQRLSAGDVKSVNSVTPVNGNITLTKSDIGLGNVDNTADADKTVACACCAVNACCASSSYGSQFWGNLENDVAYCNPVNDYMLLGAPFGCASTSITEICASCLCVGTARGVSFGANKLTFSTTAGSSAPAYILGLDSYTSGNDGVVKLVDASCICLGNAQYAVCSGYSCCAGVADEARIGETWGYQNTVTLVHSIASCACTESTMLLGIACGTCIGSGATVEGFYTCDLSVREAGKAKEADCAYEASSVNACREVRFHYCCCGATQGGNIYAVCVCSSLAGIFTILKEQTGQQEATDIPTSTLRICNACTWIPINDVCGICSCNEWTESYHAMQFITHA